MEFDWFILLSITAFAGFAGWVFLQTRSKKAGPVNTINAFEASSSAEENEAKEIAMGLFKQIEPYMTIPGADERKEYYELRKKIIEDLKEQYAKEIDEEEEKVQKDKADKLEEEKKKMEKKQAEAEARGEEEEEEEEEGDDKKEEKPEPSKLIRPFFASKVVSHPKLKDLQALLLRRCMYYLTTALKWQEVIDKMRVMEEKRQRIAFASGLIQHVHAISSFLNYEMDLVREEANELRDKWGEFIVQQAYQLSVELEGKKKTRVEKAKGLENEKKKADEQYEELMKEEEASSKKNSGKKNNDKNKKK